MKKIFGLLAVTLLTLSSCKSYEVSYAVSLESVESPANIKQQFGDTKIVTLEDAGISKYRYTDNYIEITWFVDRKEFAFTLKNKSKRFSTFSTNVNILFCINLKKNAAPEWPCPGAATN